MKNRKKLMDRFIKEDEEKIFELFYKLIRGKVDINLLTDEEKILAECVKNQCTDKDGKCYEFYCSLKKIRNSKNKEKIIDLYENIVKTMCEEMFFNALKLGMVIKNTL